MKLKRTATGKTAYLFGNGINRRPDLPEGDRYEWGNLLQNLNTQFIDGEIRNLNLPDEDWMFKKEFPFVYDEIVNRANDNERAIKEYIQEGISQLIPNNRYLDFSNLRCDEILTTNYDYLFERQLDQNWIRGPFARTDQSLYSLYRNHIANSKRIWHIHGEQDKRNSILLGFKHYVDYSSKVKERAQKCSNEIYNDLYDGPKSWVDCFLTHDVNLVGIGMKFSEYPLWWLLAYRFYKSQQTKLKINNEIRFVIQESSLNENVNVIDAMKAYGVKILPIPSIDYNDFYKKVLNNELDDHYNND
jgi:hypothetical protein